MKKFLAFVLMLTILAVNIPMTLALAPHALNISSKNMSTGEISDQVFESTDNNISVDGMSSPPLAPILDGVEVINESDNELEIMHKNIDTGAESSFVFESNKQTRGANYGSTDPLPPVSSDRLTEASNYDKRVVEIETDLGTGSGFIFSYGEVGTIGHVIYDESAKKWASWAKIIIKSDGETTDKTVYANDMYKINQHVQFGDNKDDFAVLSVSSDPFTKYGSFGYEWFTSSINNKPINLSAFYSGIQIFESSQTGYLSSDKYFNVKVRVDHGMSGGPVYPETDRVWGPLMNIATLNGSTYYLAYRFNRTVVEWMDTFRP